MSTSTTARYGKNYWCVKTGLSSDGEIYVMADEAKILPDGSLALIQKKFDEADRINIAFAPGYWTAFFAASTIDGAAVAVEIWKDEVDRDDIDEVDHDDAD